MSCEKAFEGLSVEKIWATVLGRILAAAMLRRVLRGCHV